MRSLLTLLLSERINPVSETAYQATILYESKSICVFFPQCRRPVSMRAVVVEECYLRDGPAASTASNLICVVLADKLAAQW